MDRTTPKTSKWYTPPNWPLCLLLTGFILLDLSNCHKSSSFSSFQQLLIWSVTIHSCPSALVLEFAVKHNSGLLLTYRDGHVRWYKWNPSPCLLHALSHKFQCLVRVIPLYLPSQTSVLILAIIPLLFWWHPNHLLFFPFLSPHISAWISACLANISSMMVVESKTHI